MFNKILFVIDEMELKYFEFNDLVTNFWFVKEFLSRGYEVDITTKNNLFVEQAKGMAKAYKSFLKDNNIFYDKNIIKKQINDYDTVFFRPDPPFDIDYLNACYVFDFVDTEKTVLINNPRNIRNFNEKFHVNYFPNYAPKNIVTSSKDEIREFVNKEEKAIIKPLNRCFGSGVFILQKGDKNINSIILSLTENEKTLVMVQSYLEKAVLGDKRVLIIGEKVYDECIRKLPGDNDFKFNTHNDKFFEATSLSTYEKSMAEDIAKILNKKELYLTGLDVIDEKIIEINVTSPCYFIREINNAYGIHFEEKIMEDTIALINIKLGQDEYSLCSK